MSSIDTTDAGMVVPVLNLARDYDLTLLVGSPNHRDGQIRLQVSSAILKLISPVWYAMLGSRFVESSKSEIPFPDDSANAFTTVLQIAHFKVEDIDDKMCQEDLIDIAKVSDKYDVVRIVFPYINSKHWLLPFKETGVLWNRDVDLDKWLFFTSIFKMDADTDYLTNRLALTLSKDEKKGFTFRGSNGAERVLLDHLSEPVLGKIHYLRQTALQHILEICQAALNSAFEDTCVAHVPTCQAAKVGILVVELGKSGLYPLPETIMGMSRSVWSYWLSFKNLDKYRTWDTTCHKSHQSSKFNERHSSSVCSFQTCIKDLKIKDQVWENITTIFAEQCWNQPKLCNSRVIHFDTCPATKGADKMVADTIAHAGT